MSRLGIGIVGAGMMAERMAATLVKMDAVEIRAIASRDGEKARGFAGTYGIPKAYGDYVRLVDDPDVQLVYIATPNSFHHEHCLLCLEHGKHVLCEKPFTMTSAQAREIFALGKKKHLLVAEAMWTRYMPFMHTMRTLLDDGVLGNLVFLEANIGNAVKHRERLREPLLGGGALLDLGVYALHFAAAFIDERPTGIMSSRVKLDTGVDAQNAVVLSYPSGVMATLSSTIMAATDKCGMIYGDEGYLLVENINNPQRAHRYSSDREFIETLTAPEQISGLEYEIQSVAQAVRDGLDECPELPHEAILDALELVEEIQAKW